MGLVGPLVALAAAAGPRTVRVSCAISLRPALAEIIDSQRREHPDLRFLINAGGSGLLAQQVIRGAPVDLFVSASSVELERLQGEGLVLEGSRRVIAGNSLVIVSPAGAPLPGSLNGLSDPAFDTIAVGNPKTAPLGRYTAQTLAHHGLDDVLRERLVYGENARQVGEYVARGEAAAGLVYRSDALLLGNRVRIGPEIPTDSHDPVVYEAAAIGDSEMAPAVEALVQELASARSRAIFSRHGFTSAR